MHFFKKIISRFSRRNGEFYFELKNLLGFSPNNLKYYQEAFTHSSYKHSDSSYESYERLEFLGDAVLGAIISHYLFDKVPDQNEGYLTKMRSKMVQRNYLNELGKELKLCKFLRVENKNSHLGDNICGNLFEALIGAIYLDRGYQYATCFIHRVLINTKHIDLKKWEGKVISYKSLMVEWSQKHRKKIAFETFEDSEYNSNIKFFVCNLLLEGQILSKGRETSKKRAEEKAAKRAYFRIKGNQTKR